MVSYAGINKILPTTVSCSMMRRLLEIAGLFLKLGTISFGGHAVHIATMEHEVIQRRGWLSHSRFLDLIGVTNLIPGPNAVEMASHIGYLRAGLLGSLVGGLCFTLPAVLITIVCAWGYVQCEDLPAVEPLFFGIKPVVLALIVAAVWRLGKRALQGWRPVVICASAVTAVLAGCDEVIALLVLSAAGALLLRNTGRGRNAKDTTARLAGVALAGTAQAARAAPASTIVGMSACACAATAGSVSLWKLGLFFLKVGAVMYGGGYVLIAYIEGGLVGTYGLTQEELLNAVAIGQLTPGPMLTTATFVGYLLGGLPGAAVATLGILAPSFCFVAAVNPLIARMRNLRWASLLLDAVGAASIGLIISVAVTLSRTTLVDWRSWLIALIAGVLAMRWRVSPAWLVIGGAIAGWLLWPVT